MNLSPASGRPTLLATVLGLAIWITAARAQLATGDQSADGIRILELQGKVEISPAGATTWVLTQTNQALHPSDKLRTGADSRVTIRWSDQSVVSFGALTVLEILPPHEPGAANGLNLLGGLLSFFHRDTPGRIRVISRGAAAGVKGTEFVVAIEIADGTERTRLSVIDGNVEFTNELGALVITNNQQAVAELGKAPVRTPVFDVNNVLQWCFYYPAVLDLRDLPLTAEEEPALSDSLAAYRGGDLLAALARYPAARQPRSDAQRVYYAALLLSVGQVEKTEAALAALPAGDPSERLQRLATALRELIAAVKLEPSPSTKNPQLSTEFLAASYYEQSRAVREDSLKAALTLARQAATNSPKFGFAWARVAELEFSFAHTSRALEALNKSLELAPRNAQALALKGFLFAAQNNTREAIEWFNRSIAVDGALGNAWLGRGLCRIRRGDAIGGREDLLVAAALEPQRSLLRSYLGKGYSDAVRIEQARHEFDLAKHLDSADPTPWLYSALLSRQENQINAAVNELEKSLQLNDNRRVYRSELLLDQDRAVRGASLASIYREAGMPEVSVREAAGAVTYDYANYSAHLFLANSYDALRDPTRFNLRYETAWFNELLLANLLAPAGAGAISPDISQQEYFRLFERDRFGLTSTTDVRSDGQYREVVSQFGSAGRFSYSLDLDYQHNDGVRPNNELNRIEWYSQLKFQLTPSDTLFLLTKYQDYHSGDNFQHFDWRQSVRTNFTFDEFQTPIIVGGYHKEWSPGVHTLLLAGRLINDQRFSDRSVPELVILKETNSTINGVVSQAFDVDYHSEFEAYTVELAQILQGGRQTLIFGGRAQGGQFDTHNGMTANSFTNFFPEVSTETTDDFQRTTAYAYYTLEPIKDLFATAGLSYDRVEYPANHRSPPIFSGGATKDLISPKAAIVYGPAEWITLRGTYTRSLGGVTLDQSFRLEPTQLAGFIQTFRSVIPESVVGSVSAPEFETYGAALDLKFKTGTYVGIQAERLSSDVTRDIGVFDVVNLTAPSSPSSTGERLDFEERSIGITLNQLLADEWSCGVSYKFTSSELNSHLLEIPSTIYASFTNANNTDRSDLHQLGAYLLFNHRSGFFSRAEVNWYSQDNILHTFDTSSARVKIDLPGDAFSQFNLYAGWRFPRQRGDLTLGVLNVGGGDYHLNPLNSYAELPHERVYAARLRVRF